MHLKCPVLNAVCYNNYWGRNRLIEPLIRSLLTLRTGWENFLMTATLNTVSGGHFKYSRNLSTVLTESRYGDLRLFGSSSLFFLRLFCSLLATKEYLIFMPSLRSGTIKSLTVILCWSPELKAISLRSIWPMNLSSLSWLEMKKRF